MKALRPTVSLLTLVVWVWIGGMMWWTAKAAAFLATVGISDAPSFLPFYAAIAFAALETAVILFRRHILGRAFMVMSAVLLLAALTFISYGTYRAAEATLQAAGGHLQAEKGAWSNEQK